ncbi:MAG: IclR family transcriptional regulator [Candidatus Velthaea sp.]
MPVKSSPTNAIQKACAIVRLLAQDSPLRLSELAGRTDLNKVTVLRVLDTLIGEGFVRPVHGSKTYALGPEAHLLAAVTRMPANIRDAARPSLVRLAAMSGDAAVLSIRSGSESLCIDRVTGNFPIGQNYLDIGSRRPLGVGGGSMALLAWLPPREIDAIVETVAARISNYPRYSPAFIREEAALARARGYVVLLDVTVDQMGGVAVPIRTSGGECAGALSIAALSERISSRRDTLVAALQREAAIVAEQLA